MGFVFGDSVVIKNKSLLAENITLAPVPAREQVTILLSGKLVGQTLDVAVHDNQGRTINVATTALSNQRLRVATNGLAPGMYHMVIRNQGETITRKFTVVR